MAVVIVIVIVVIVFLYLILVGADFYNEESGAYFPPVELLGGALMFAIGVIIVVALLRLFWVRPGTRIRVRSIISADMRVLYMGCILVCLMLAVGSSTMAMHPRSPTSKDTCIELVEESATYSSRWTDGLFGRKFYEYDHSDETDVTVWFGDRIQFQNGFGAWSNMRYACKYVEGYVKTTIEQGYGRVSNPNW